MKRIFISFLIIALLVTFSSCSEKADETLTPKTPSRDPTTPKTPSSKPSFFSNLISSYFRFQAFLGKHKTILYGLFISPLAFLVCVTILHTFSDSFAFGNYIILTSTVALLNAYIFKVPVSELFWFFMSRFNFLRGYAFITAFVVGSYLITALPIYASDSFELIQHKLGRASIWIQAMANGFFVGTFIFHILGHFIILSIPKKKRLESMRIWRGIMDFPDGSKSADFELSVLDKLKKSGNQTIKHIRRPLWSTRMLLGFLREMSYSPMIVFGVSFAIFGAMHRFFGHTHSCNDLDHYDENNYYDQVIPDGNEIFNLNAMLSIIPYILESLIEGLAIGKTANIDVPFMISMVCHKIVESLAIIGPSITYRFELSRKGKYLLVGMCTVPILIGVLLCRFITGELRKSINGVNAGAFLSIICFDMLQHFDSSCLRFSLIVFFIIGVILSKVAVILTTCQGHSHDDDDDDDDDHSH